MKKFIYIFLIGLSTHCLATEKDAFEVSLTQEDTVTDISNKLATAAKEAREFYKSRPSEKVYLSKWDVIRPRPYTRRWYLKNEAKSLERVNNTSARAAHDPQAEKKKYKSEVLWVKQKIDKRDRHTKKKEFRSKLKEKVAIAKEKRKKEKEKKDKENKMLGKLKEPGKATQPNNSKPEKPQPNKP